MSEKETSAEVQLPSSQPALLKALRWEIIATLLLALGFGVLGYFLSGSTGVVGGVLGATIAGVLSLLTIGSIAFANHRFITSKDFVVIFFGIVAGGWLLKLVLFIVALVLLRDQSWLDSTVLFFALVGGIVVSLILDVLVVTKTRMPVIDETRN